MGWEVPAAPQTEPSAKWPATLEWNGDTGLSGFYISTQPAGPAFWPLRRP
jgi:hypothetical protein